MTVVTPAPSAPAVDDAAPPLLVVVDAESPGETSLRRAAAIATTLGCPVEVLLIFRRLGFTTDAALVASTHRHRREQVDRAVEVLKDLLPHHPVPTTRMQPYSWWPRRDCSEQARRAIRAATRNRRHRMVMAPPRLAQRSETPGVSR